MYALTLQPVPGPALCVPGRVLTLRRPLIDDRGLDVHVADLFVRLHSLGWGGAHRTD